ncbi:uncharacterized protein FTOL_00826 [Fusarium torulosum]|uniref:Fatty acid desaturase domain-containing protein n=1 Tax=Fusarium torulosum TaxID=33205 RepID=A0AAE8SCU5_9HYPO|nr:uncharacterized protein FTOL_00826 [Fusarium torulosum]
MSHHVFTNIGGLDIDSAAPDGSYRRIRPSQNYSFLYVAQFIYAPILYVFLRTTICIEDIYNLLRQKRGHLRVNPLTWEQYAVFWGGKAFFVGTRFILPYIWGASMSHVMSCFLVSDVDLDWARLQVETAQDYAHPRPLTTFFTGGLNYQVVHHLFPNVAQGHLGQLASIVRRPAQDHGAKYSIKDSLWDAIGGHLGLLKLMGTQSHGLEG